MLMANCLSKTFWEPYADRTMVEDENCTNADKAASQLGLGCNTRFLSCGYLAFPLMNALLIITALGMAAILPSATACWVLVGVGAGITVTNILMGNMKNRPFSAVYFTALSAVIIALGVTGGLGVLPMMTVGTAALIAMFVGNCILAYGCASNIAVNTFLGGGKKVFEDLLPSRSIPQDYQRANNI